MRVWVWLSWSCAAVGACSNDFDGLVSGGPSGSTATGTGADGGEGVGPGGAGAAPATSSTGPASGGGGAGGEGNGGSGPGGAGGCTAPLQDCNGGNDGCESNTDVDPLNCGGCGVACSAPLACVGGACKGCGDTMPEAPEECDDGNLVAGDGCGPTCLTEHPDDCPGAPIPLAAGTFTITGNTSGANDTMQDTDGASACDGTWPGGDLIYAVTPAAGGTLFATLASSFDTHYLRARETCPDGNILACDYASSAGDTDEISFAVSAGGTYYVVVDSWGNTSGAFTLTLALQP